MISNNINLISLKYSLIKRINILIYSYNNCGIIHSDFNCLGNSQKVLSDNIYTQFFQFRINLKGTINKLNIKRYDRNILQLS